MSQYILTSKKKTGSATFEYDSNGLLKAFKSDFEEQNLDGLIFLLKRALTLEDFLKMKESPSIKIEELRFEVTFKDFYEPYPRKDGSKDKAEKAWERLSKNNQWLAYSWLEKYKNILARNPTQAILHAATYLNQKRWLD